MSYKNCNFTFHTEKEDIFLTINEKTHEENIFIRYFTFMS